MLTGPSGRTEVLYSSQTWEITYCVNLNVVNKDFSFVLKETCQLHSHVYIS